MTIKNNLIRSSDLFYDLSKEYFPGPVSINAIKTASTILHQFKNTSLFGQYEFAIQKILDRAISSEKPSSHNEDQIIQFETLPTIRGNENLELFLRMH